jgi:hypothetical protein
MDPELNASIDRLAARSEGGDEPTVSLRREGGVLRVLLRAPGGEEIDRPLKPLADLYAEKEGTPAREIDPEEYLTLLRCIEGAISAFYDEHPDTTDARAIRVLEGLIDRLEPEEPGPMRLSIQDHLRLELSLNDWSRFEVLACLRKIRKSVKLHRAGEASQVYLEFISRFT